MNGILRKIPQTERTKKNLFPLVQEIKDEIVEYPLGKFIEYIEDDDHIIERYAILAGDFDDRFKESEDWNLNFGNSTSTYWI